MTRRTVNDAVNLSNIIFPHPLLQYKYNISIIMLSYLIQGGQNLEYK